MGNISKNIYCNYRNILTLSIRTAKTSYYTRLFENVRDSKNYWNKINKVLKPNGNKHHGDIEINIDGTLVSDGISICSGFNNYFASIPNALRSAIPPSNVDPLSYVIRQLNSFVLSDTDQAEVTSIMLGFKNKKTNIHSIPNFIYKEISVIVSPLISELINESFARGTVPDILKVAKVIPVHKSGNRDEFSQYRPISTLHYISKVFEKTMYTRLRSLKKKLICYLICKLALWMVGPLQMLLSGSQMSFIGL